MDCRVKPGNDEFREARRPKSSMRNAPFRAMTICNDPDFRRGICATTMPAMDDFPIVPPLVIKDTPKPRRLTKLAEARDYVDEAMRIGHPEPWREVWHRLKAVTNEEDAIEAIGDLRELLEEEDLLLPSTGA